MKANVIRSLIPVAAAAICLTACGRRSDVTGPLPEAVIDATVPAVTEVPAAEEAAEDESAADAEAKADAEIKVDTEAKADAETKVTATTSDNAPATESTSEAASPHKYDYTKDTSSIVKKLMKCDLKASDTSDLQSLIDDMKASDPAMGKLWDGIMNYWIYTENSLEINYDNLPDDLPDDDSLCIVIAGYELGRDGKMKPELVDRMVTGLACAKKYPNAYILVTGGPTAHDKNNTTEAGAMAAWLVEHGVDEKRLLVEEKSLSTAHNATFGNALIREKAPQVHSIAVVTSDYHVGLVSLLFYAETQRYAYETGTQPFDIVANAASRVDDPGEKISHGLAASLLSNVMEP